MGLDKGLPILIIGAGISGLTAATALGQRGFEVEVIERRAEIVDDGGIGLTIVGNAMRALDTIGIADACVAAGLPMASIALMRSDGERLTDNPLPLTGGERWPRGTGISRPAFHRILRDAAVKTATIRCGTTLTGWSEESESIVATFSDGTTRRYQLIVAADGIYSRTRRQIFPDCRPQPTGQSVWRAAVSRPASLRHTHLFFGGRHGAVGICPISDEQAYLYIVEAADPTVRRDPATLHLQMREQLEGYAGYVRELVPQLVDPALVSYRPIEWLLAPKPWGAGRVFIIGDAAHSNPPVLAQGAAMGIEDAVVLAEELNAARDDVPTALTRTLARRYDRAAFVVETSCQLARWEVEHTPGVDIPGVMRASALRLAEPA